MSLMVEIEKLMNCVDCSFNYRIVNLGGKCVYLEGFKSVINLSENEILFQVKNKAVSVEGKDLKIKYLDKTTCVINGEISGVLEKWNLKYPATIWIIL